MKTRTKITMVFLVCLALCAAVQADELLVPAEYPTIQSAIDAAFDGDTVIVAPGTYTGPGNRDIDFLGKAITVRSESGPDNCIIDCNGSRDEPHRGFYFHNNEDENSVLSGFTITNSYSSSSWPYYYGGGISCYRSSPRIFNCIIIGNSDIVFDGRGSGGISCSRDSNPTITNCTISKNKASGISCSYGSNPTIFNCTINENKGGGIHCYDSSPTITSCTISDNWAGYYSGGIYCYKSNLKLTNCIISGNSASTRGGAIRSRASTLAITNCTITGNSAPNGSALACLHYSSWGEYPSNLQITNCILTSGSNQIWNDDGSTITITYSDVQGGWPGQGNIDQGPCFAFNTDYHIMPDSPCIDAGTNDPCGGLPATDIEGIARPLDGDGDANAVADMGAYEYTPNRPSIATSASVVSFYCVESYSKPEPQTLLIRNCGTGTLNWEIVEDCNWLQISPISGASTSSINEVTLMVDPNSLATGDYTCILTVLDPNAANSPVIVQVVLHVGALLRVPSPDFPTIQAAIDAAVDYDIVLVAPGTYTGDGNRDITFYGRAITVQSINPCDPTVVAATIINCQGSNFSRHRAFTFYSYEGPRSVVAGFTIINGCAWRGGAILCSRSSPTITNCTISSNSDIIFDGGGGGGICCEHSSAVITNCTISGNSAGGNGGGIYCGRSNPTITNCAITDNRTKGDEWVVDGGGIYCEGANPAIINCTITGNSAKANWGSSGGGISCRGGSPKVTHCTISDNCARYGGGGIACEDSSPTITNCVITANTSEGNWGSSGGGVYFYCGVRSEDDCAFTITNCAISGNSARYGGGICCGGAYDGGGGMFEITNCDIKENLAEFSGGGIYCGGEGTRYGPGGIFIITDCTINGNSAASDGGAIYCEDDNIFTMTNCIMAENQGFNGGGIYFMYSNPTITNCTFTGNSALDGNGLAFDSWNQNYPSNLQMTNSILWDGGDEIFNEDNSAITITYSDVQGGWPGESNIDADPCFVQPGYWDTNGTPEDANDDVWVDGDYHLLPDSPCIDAGDPNYIPEPNETDLDGNPRVNGGRIDMGAYETNYIEAAMKFTPQTLNCNSKGNWVKAHLTLPEGFVIEDMDANTPGVIVLLGIESDYINVFINEDGLVELEIGFERAAFCAAGIDYGPAEVMVIGKLTSGQDFYGTDTIRIIGNNLKYLAVFASYWLDVDCGKPDWCGGVDLDRNSVVDFVDFALFAKDWPKQTTWHE